jgi:allophanate hydrolase
VPMSRSLVISELRAAYLAGRFTVLELLWDVLANIAKAPQRNVWITHLSHDQVSEYGRALLKSSPHELPLYGVPFAIKDNIDLQGVPTTAGCPEYGYVPQTSAHVVHKLIEAGAIPVGKTNLDQFATGLVGTRSPYGACLNSFNDAYISGGSSSGSAVAVATGLVSFALGTDTAGSGRVPAAFNNLIGLKPSVGRLSTRGVVPACRSLDCVSIFALTAEDAASVLSVAEAHDAEDPFSRSIVPRTLKHSFTFGVPRAGQLEFFGDSEYARLFHEAAARLESLGGTCRKIDFQPFHTTAKLLYEGPWLAERYAAVGEFIDRQPHAIHPTTLQIISAGRHATAVDVFRGQYRLAQLKRAADIAWGDIDVMLTPTTGTIYRIKDIENDPLRLNTNLGYYTNFVNLLDLAAVAVPAGFTNERLPFGVTLIGKAGSDADLLRLASRLHRASVQRLGALDEVIPANSGDTMTQTGERISVAVCGAHMEGLPLNTQLTSRGAELVHRGRTAPKYRFYALPGGPPFRPGLVRVAEGGASIELEVWSVPSESFGSFVAGIPSPLGIGRVELESGESVPGFLCESYAVVSAQDITALGGWRAYLEKLRSQ